MKNRPLCLCLLGFGAVIALVLLFYVWTDLAGARRWAAVAADLQARGEPLTIAEIESKPIADETNFAAAPIFAELAKIPDRTQWRISAIHGFRGASKKGSSLLANAARKVDPAFSGSDADAARVILGQTEKWRPLLDEIRAAAQRPGTVWPTDYRAGFRLKIEPIVQMLTLGQAFSAEASAYLELGNTAAALADFELILNLSNRCQNPPILITHLVRQAIVEMDVELLRSGIERHLWPPTALETMQRELSGISFLSGAAHALRGERVIFKISIDGLTADGPGIPDFSAEPKKPGDLKQRLFTAAWRLRPSGWTKEDASSYFEKLQPAIEWMSQPGSPRPDSLSTADRVLEKNQKARLLDYRTPFANAALPTLLSAIPRLVYGQAMLDEAVLACAIERYQLARSSLPETLASLHPDFLSVAPKDPISGQPFLYHTTGANSYLLYGTGWNGIDDRGSAEKASPKAFQKAEDWVWNAPR